MGSNQMSAMEALDRAHRPASLASDRITNSTRSLPCRSGYINLPELARLLGVGSHLIKSAHQEGFLPEPPKLSGRRAYDLPEVIKVAEFFGVKVSTLGDHK